jgi:hypothetical protein
LDRVYFRNYFKDYYLDRKLEYIDILGGKCFVCGDIEDLEFDHIDPKTKLFSITKFLSYTREDVLEELKKCQLLCKTDHIVKTRNENSKRVPWNKGRWNHGTLTGYCAKACRCEPCKSAGALYKKQRRAARLAC